MVYKTSLLILFLNLIFTLHAMDKNFVLSSIEGLSYLDEELHQFKFRLSYNNSEALIKVSKNTAGYFLEVTMLNGTFNFSQLDPKELFLKAQSQKPKNTQVAKYEYENGTIHYQFKNIRLTINGIEYSGPITLIKNGKKYSIKYDGPIPPNFELSNKAIKNFFNRVSVEFDQAD